MPVASLPRQDWVDEFAATPGVDVVFWDYSTPPPRDDIDYALLAWPIKNKPWEQLAHLPRLRWFQVLSAGYEYAEGNLPEGVGLLNGRGIHATATSELALALILAANRNIPEFVLAQSRGRWEPAVDLVPGIAEKRVLIVGYGDIGVALARRLRACEAHVDGVRRERHPGDDLVDRVHAMSDLPAVLGDYDVVVILTPLNADTRHLVSMEFLAAMRPDALLVNVARGGVVDTDALIASLEAGHVRAALDVTDPEPLPDDHPLFFAPRCLVVPHMGGSTHIINTRMAAFVGAQLARLGRGEPLANVVMPPTR